MNVISLMCLLILCHGVWSEEGLHCVLNKIEGKCRISCDCIIENNGGGVHWWSNDTEPVYWCSRTNIGGKSFYWDNIGNHTYDRETDIYGFHYYINVNQSTFVACQKLPEEVLHNKGYSFGDPRSNCSGNTTFIYAGSCIDIIVLDAENVTQVLVYNETVIEEVEDEQMEFELRNFTNYTDDHEMPQIQDVYNSSNKKDIVMAFMLSLMLYLILVFCIL